MTLHCKYQPIEWRQIKTILTDKPGKNSGPANWRPITIGFAIQRPFRRVLGQRLSLLIYLDPNLRRFVQKDGCLASSLILDTLIKDSTQARLGTSLISTDLRKAFHPVSHFSILRSLRRVHAPPYLSGYIQETLTSSSTVIHVNQESLDPIAINRGVRQGDSLNPILFNIVLDELVEELASSNMGCRMEGGCDAQY